MLKEDFRTPRRHFIVSSWLGTALLLTAMQVSSGTATLTISPTLPEKNCMATISCSSTLDKQVHIFMNGSILAVCNNVRCLPQQSPDGSRVYSVTNREAKVTIKSLNRDRDQGKWKCPSVEADSIDILVYKQKYVVKVLIVEITVDDVVTLQIFTTVAGPGNFKNTDSAPCSVQLLDTNGYLLQAFPSSLSLTYGGNTDFDLANSSVTLQCQADTCTYPAPSLKWYCSNVQGNKAQLYNATSATMEGVGGNCSFPENIFASSLILPIYTTWHNNSDKTVKFFCGIEYLDSSRNINSSTSKAITFAVRVSEVELEHSSQSLRNVSSLNVTSGETVTLKCVSGISRPVPTIDWYIGGENKGSGINDTFTFIPRSIDHNKEIFCRAYNVDPKRTVDSRGCRLYVRGFAPPAADPFIEWYVGSEMRSSRTRQFYFTPSNEDHDKPIYCRAYTLQPSTAVESYKPKLSVEDYPVIIYNVSSPLTVNETQSVSVICEAKGNPTPNVIRWKDRQEGNVLRFNNLKRQDTGTYTCEATAQSKSSGTLTSEKQLDIVVQYAPDINVTLSGTTMQNQTVLLICEARGVPAKNTFYPWRHMWKNDVIRTGLEGTTTSTHTTLLIDRLSLENSGTYICSATNGIRGNKGTFKQTGSNFINVTGNPTIQSRNSIFTGEIGQYVNISIPFYSNPAMECFYIQKNGTPLSNASYISTYLLPEYIDFQMYGKSVQLEAQVAHIVVQNLSQNDFANYTLMLRNPIGQTEFTFQLKSDGPPFRVEIFNFSRFLAAQIELHFHPGFNGGFEQTFVIEYSSWTGLDNVWHNTSVTNLKEKDSPYKLPKETFSVNVSKLPPGDYLYRMYSWNVRGKSPYSESIRVTIPILTKATGDDKYNAGHQRAVIVGNGIGTSVLVVIIIALVLFILKNRSKQKKSQLEMPADQNEVNRHEVRTGLIPTGANTDINNVYEILQNRGQVDNPYLELQRISAATREMDSRIEAERFRLHTSKTSSTSHEQESPRSSNFEVHSYLEVAEPTPWGIDVTANRSPDMYILDNCLYEIDHDHEENAEAGYHLYENTTVCP